MPTILTARSTSSAPDSACAAAADLARAAALEVAGDLLGEYLRVEADAERLVTHYFASTESSYVGWAWAVTVARAPRSKLVTVCEIYLLPGSDALVAPEWLPWSERLRPGDLGVGDMLPTAPDDDRLVPGYVASDDPAVEEVALQIGLGRPRVMSWLGRLEAADRWYDGDRGPQAPIALAAPAACGTCGFYLPLAGSMRAAFGACGNEFAPDDGMVVAADHGCGAHSEALIEAPSAPAAGPVVLDDALLDLVPDLLAVSDPDTDWDADADPDTESLGHS